MGGCLTHSPGPPLPGWFSHGRMVRGTERNMREAVAQHGASLPERGEPVPRDVPAVSRGRLDHFGA